MIKRPCSTSKLYLRHAGLPACRPGDHTRRLLKDQLQEPYYICFLAHLPDQIENFDTMQISGSHFKRKPIVCIYFTELNLYYFYLSLHCCMAITHTHTCTLNTYPGISEPEIKVGHQINSYHF